MKDKEELFKLLHESVETPQESFAVEEMIRKVEGTMPPIETVSATQKKFMGVKFYKKKRVTTIVVPSAYIVSFGRTLTAKFPKVTTFTTATSFTTITTFQILNSSRRKNTRKFILQGKLSAVRRKKQNLSALSAARNLRQ